MRLSDFNIQIRCVCNRLNKVIAKTSLNLFMFSLSVRQANMNNNQRRMKRAPMIRKRAYFKNWQNKNRRNNQI